MFCKQCALEVGKKMKICPRCGNRVFTNEAPSQEAMSAKDEKEGQQAERATFSRTTNHPANSMTISEGIRLGMRVSNRLTIFAVLLVVFSFIIKMLTGELTVPPFGELISALLVVLGMAAIMYLVMGVLGGALFALLRPMAETYFGAGFLGFLVGTLVYGIAGVVVSLVENSDFAFYPAPILGLLVGMPVALFWRWKSLKS